MCGICGIVGLSEISFSEEQIAGKMLRALKHRGPDAQVVSKSGNGIFGHARLSIIDPTERSNQPMYAPDGNSVLVFNGEIYNYQELKRSLISSGEVFQTTGDTEVLLRLLTKKGIRALSDLRGMFAFAYYSSSENSVLLARDPFGKKPIYWTKKGEKFGFSSEIRSLNIFAGQSEFSDLASFLAYQAPVPGSGFLKGIFEVPAGGWLLWKNGEISEGRFFDLADAMLQAEGKSAISKEEFRATFEKAVERRLVSDVPIGAFLSGGIDSTAVVSAMKKFSKSEVKTFTVGFDSAISDETAVAKQTAKRVGTNHTSIKVSESDILSWISRAVKDMDVPSADALNTWIVSKVTKEAGITVALSGLGGDELFSGYPSSNVLKNIEKMGFITRFLAHKEGFTNRLSLKFRKLALAASEPNPFGAVKASRIVFDPCMIQELGLESAFVPKNQYHFRDDANGLAFAEFELYCKRLLLRDSDQMSMAHALELRVPFLDVDFLDAAVRLNAQPEEQRIAHKKWRFIQQFPEYFSPDLIESPKKGFILPMDSWMRGPLKSFTETGLFETDLDRMLDLKGVRAFYNKFLNRNPSATWSRIWLLCIVGHWVKKNRTAE